MNSECESLFACYFENIGECDSSSCSKCSQCSHFASCDLCENAEFCEKYNN